MWSSFKFSGLLQPVRDVNRLLSGNRPSDLEPRGIEGPIHSGYSLGNEPLRATYLRTAERASVVFEEMGRDQLLREGAGRLIYATEVARHPILYSVESILAARFDSSSRTLQFPEIVDNQGRATVGAQIIGVERRVGRSTSEISLLDSNSEVTWLNQPTRVELCHNMHVDGLWRWAMLAGLASGGARLPYVVGEPHKGERLVVLLESSESMALSKLHSNTEDNLNNLKSIIRQSWNGCFSSGKCRVPQPGRTLSELARIQGLEAAYFSTHEGYDVGRAVIWRSQQSSSLKVQGDIPEGLLVDLKKHREHVGSLPTFHAPKGQVEELAALIRGEPEVSLEELMAILKRIRSAQFAISVRHLRDLEPAEVKQIFPRPSEQRCS